MEVPSTDLTMEFNSVAIHLTAPAIRFWMPDRVRHDDFENKLSI